MRVVKQLIARAAAWTVLGERTRGWLLGALFLVVVPCQLQAGLVAHYSLDGSAVDSSGNGHNGTVFGATGAVDRFGQANHALAFDGVDDYVNIAQLLFNGDDATVAFWAKSAGNQNQYAAMVSQGHGGDFPPSLTGFAFQYGFPSTTSTDFVFGDGGSAGWNTLAYPVDLEANLGWHHYAFTKSGNTIKTYFDTSLVGTSSAGLVFSSYGFSIGRDTFNTDASHRAFNGSIDDLYVYNSALTQDQIRTIATARAVPEPSTIVALMSGGLWSASWVLRKRRPLA